MKIVVFILVTACSLPLFTQEAASAEARLSSREIKTTVIGHVITIITPEGKAGPFLAAQDGILRSKARHANTKGKWRVRDDRLCFDSNTTVDHACLTVVRRDHDTRRLFLFTSSGTPFGELMVRNR